MPHIETIERTVYSFDELSDRAKERARDKYRERALDHGWWEYVYEDADTVAKLMGIEIGQKPVKLMGGKTRYDPAIYFSGFSSQGDGASFEGMYYFKAGAVKAVKTHAPKDAKLHQIAQDITDAQKANGFKLQASIMQRGRYHHLSIEVEKDAQAPIAPDTEDALIQALRDFADWIYRQLEAEHNYQLSAEAIDEYLGDANQQYDENGNRI